MAGLPRHEAERPGRRRVPRPPSTVVAGLVGFFLGTVGASAVIVCFLYSDPLLGGEPEPYGVRDVVEWSLRFSLTLPLTWFVGAITAYLVVLCTRELRVDLRHAERGEPDGGVPRR